MPSQYRRDAARLKAEIAARVAGGETLRAVCASPGMPGVDTLRAWGRADGFFGADLAVARRRGTWTRLWGYDEAKAAAFLARARAGEPVKSLLGQPGMPSRGLYRRWKMMEAPFAEAMFALRHRRDAQLAERGRARRRDFDQALADRIIVALNKGIRTGVGLRAVLAADPDLPSDGTLLRWRRERPAFDTVLRQLISAGRAAIKPVPEPMIEAVVSHIVQGGSLASFGRLPDTPSQRTLSHWLRDPNFAAEVARACDWREDWYLDQIEEILDRTPAGSEAEMNRATAPLRQQLGRLRNRPGVAQRKKAR